METHQLILSLGTVTHTVSAPKTLAELLALIPGLFGLSASASVRVDFCPADSKAPVQVRDQSAYDSLRSHVGLVLTVVVEEAKDDFELVEPVAESTDIPSKKPVPAKPASPHNESATQTLVAKTNDIGSGIGIAHTAPEATNTEQAQREDKGLSVVPESSDEATQSHQEEETEPCFMGVGRNGKCELCGGVGKVRKGLSKVIQDWIRKEVAARLPPPPKLVLTGNQLLKSQIVATLAREGQQKVVHAGTKCAACGISPIIGVRFGCTVCPRFDLCESCEAVLTHEHPLIKFREPEAKIPVQPKAPATEPEKKYYAKCTPAGLIKDDNSCAAATKAAFAMVWRLENTGDLKWPKDTVLTWEAGEVTVLPVSVGEVVPKAHVDITINMVASTRPGKYVVFFQLAHDSTKTFGQKFWTDVTVVPNTISALRVEEGRKLGESSAEERRMIELVKRVSRMKIPEEYVENVMKVAQMYETIDPEKIFEMLKVYKNDTEVVANLLLNQT